MVEWSCLLTLLARRDWTKNAGVEDQSTPATTGLAGFGGGDEPLEHGDGSVPVAVHEQGLEVLEFGDGGTGLLAVVDLGGVFLGELTGEGWVAGEVAVHFGLPCLW